MLLDHDVPVWKQFRLRMTRQSARGAREAAAHARQVRVSVRQDVGFVIGP